jgi:hypothetical protein
MGSVGPTRVRAVLGAALVAGSLGGVLLVSYGTAAAMPPAGASTVSSGSATSAAAGFCSRLSIPQIDAIVGAHVSLVEVTTKGKILACVYQGIPDNLSIETQTGLPLSSVSSNSAAEAGTKSAFPPRSKLSFAAVPSFGPVAFTWTTHISGQAFSGLNVYKGTTGYFVEMGGGLKLSPLEKLVKLAIAAATPARR